MFRKLRGLLGLSRVSQRPTPSRWARLSMECLEDRLAPAVLIGVTGTTPGLTAGILQAGTTALSIQFSGNVSGGANAGNYSLVNVGPDALLGTADDVAHASCCQL